MPDDDAEKTGALQGDPPPDPPADPPADDPPADDPPKPKTLDQLLANLDEDQRRIVQGEVTKARNEAKNLRDRLKAAEPKAAEHDKALEAQKTAEQRAHDAATAAQQRADQLLARAIRGEIKALAAEKFADPDDPGGFLDVSRYANADGEVDTDAIVADLDDLLTRKPHLAKPTPGPRPPAPNRAQGTSGGGAATPEVTPGMGRLRQAYNTSPK